MTDSGLNIGAGSEFFDDQIIYKEDLQNIEYTKIKTIRDTIAACISQSGVAIASLTDTLLKVVYVDSAHFSVNPGTAIDKYGRIIYVPNDISVYDSISDFDYHPQWPNRENITHDEAPAVTTRYYVNIYYATQEDVIEIDDVGSSYYARTYDSYRIEVENFEAGSGSFVDGICLASFQVNSSGEIIYSIDDFRPILQMKTQGGFVSVSGSIGARVVYNQTSIATEVLNNTVLPNRFSTNSVNYQIQAYFAYMHRGQGSMNVNFFVPPYSAPYPGTLEVVVGSVSGSYSYTYTGPKTFSFDISSLSVGTKYQAQIWLKKDELGNTYVRDIVIDVS